LLFLNSDVATYIYKKISVPKANGYSIYKNAFLKEMPIILEDEAQLEKFDDMTQGEFNSYLRDILQISDDENSLIETTLEAYREG
jgi:hypothetical protein